MRWPWQAKPKPEPQLPERRSTPRPPPEAEQMFAWGHAVQRLAEHLEELVDESEARRARR